MNKNGKLMTQFEELIKMGLKDDVALRQANVISYRLPSNIIHSAVALGDVHYKDNYKDDTELWKPIDLTIVNGRMDKAPYILEVKDNKTTITCKKTGRQSVVEMKSIGTVDVSKDTLLDQKSVAVDTDYKLVLHPDKVKFQRTLLSDKAPLGAKFKITGNLPISNHGLDCIWDIERSGAGSSGLLACMIGLALGYDKIILAGVPLDDSGHFFDIPDVRTSFNALNIQLEWKDADQKYLKGRVKSLSGYSAKWLGEVPQEWLND